MIDYNKYSTTQTKMISPNRAAPKGAVRKRTSKLKKLTEENKIFLKTIGLLK